MEFVDCNVQSLLDSQLGIWYSSQAQQSSKLYTTAQSVRLKGNIVFKALHSAILLALNESEILRFGYCTGLAGPTLKHSLSQPSVEICDLRETLNANSVVQNKIAQVLKAVPPLDSEELNWHCLYIISDCEVIWFSRIHHVAFDSYAYQLVQRRAAEYYHSILSGNLVPPSVHTPLQELRKEDVAYRSSTQYGLDRDFWLDYGRSFPSPTFTVSSPYPYAEINIQAECTISNIISAEAEIFRKKFKASIADVLVALFGSYFSRFNGSEEILFGLPVMGRLTANSSHAIVTRSNILPFHFAIAKNDSFNDICSTVEQLRKRVSPHQRYRSEWISRDLGRIGNSIPAHGIELNILKSSHPLKFLGLSVDIDHVATGPVRDLNLHIEVDDNLRLKVIRMIANGTRHTVERLQLHLERIQHWLAKLLSNPTSPIADLQFASVTELELIKTWNATNQRLSSSFILDLFCRQVQKLPGQIAVIDESRALTFSELDERTRKVARSLQDIIGPNRKAVVGVMIERSVDLQVALLAVLRSGAVILPLSCQTPRSRLASMLKQANASFVITNENHSNLPEHVASLKLQTLHQNSRLCQEIHSVDGGDGAYILFTSGSTGEPKGVLISHLALANRLQWMQDQYNLGSHDRVLQKTPVTFDVSIWEFFWPMISGATLVMARPQGHTDPDYLLECIEKYNITTLHFVPSMLALFVETHERRQGSLNVARVFASGEALPQELAVRTSKILDAPIFNLYGPTEAAIDVTHYEVRTCAGVQTVPIGRPIWNTKIHILNHTLQEAPIGASGELFIEGICLADGYIGNPQLTAERFIFLDEKRLYRTGDLARWSEKGEIEFLGRMDTQVKVRGVRIELEEISNVLLRYRGISAAKVLVHSERIVAYVVSEHDTNESLIIEHLSKYLPDYMTPQQVFFLQSLPLTTNGKFDLKLLPSPKEIPLQPAAPSCFIEQRICEYFADVLGLDSFGLDSNFFELGGHSLTAVDVASRINIGLGWNISIATIFAHPTPRRLAIQGEEDQNDMLAPLLLLRPSPNSKVNLPTLFCIHPAGGIAWCYSGIARYLKTPCRIVGIQASGLTPSTTIADSMEAIAHDYADKILIEQSEGPYWLIGWSVGGMIAHSVAACLERRGRTVGLLALMDSYPSDLWRQFAFTEQSKREEESMALAALLFIAGISLPFDCGLPSLTIPNGQFLDRDEVIVMLRRHGNALASLDDLTLDRLIDVVINSRRLVGASQHDRFNGDMIFFTAARPRAEEWLTLGAWRPYVDGKIINVDVDSDHPGMARPESLKVIAKHLDRILRPQKPQIKTLRLVSTTTLSKA